MFNLILTLLFLWISLLTAQPVYDLSNQEITKLPNIGYIIRWDHTVGVRTYLVENVNQDSTPEIIAYINREDIDYKGIHIYSPDQQVVDIHTIYYDILSMLVTPPTGDHGYRLFTIGVENKYDLYVHEYYLESDKIRPHRKKIILTGSDKNADQKWDVNTGLNKIYRHPDTNQEIILVLNTGYDLSPRGIFSIDLADLSVKWSYEIGGAPRRISFDDADRDGVHEILFVTASPDNHYTVNDVADSAAYFIKLSSDGKEINKYIIGAQYCYPVLEKIWFKNTDYNYLINVNSRAKGRKRPNYVQFIDPENLNPKFKFSVKNRYDHLRFPFFLNKVLLKDFILPVANTSGTFYALNNELEQIAEYTPEFPISMIFAADLNQDNKPEYIFINKPENYYILTDGHLNVFGKQVYNGIEYPQLISNLSAISSKIFYINEYLYEWNIPYSDVTSLSGFETIFNRNLSVLIYSTLAILIVVGIVFISVRVSKKLRNLNLSRNLYNYLLQNQRKSTILLDQDLLVIEYNNYFAEHFNIHGKNITGYKFSYLCEIIALPDLSKKVDEFINNESHTGNNGGTVISSIENARKYLCNCDKLKPTKNLTIIIVELIDLTHITYSEQLAAWGSLTQRMAHEIKNPLTTLLLTLRQIQRKYLKNHPEDTVSFDNYITSAAEEIERLRNSINTLMRFTSTMDDNISNIDINAQIIDCLKMYSQYENIHIRLNLAAALPQISFDEQKIRQVINHLLENSVDAVEGSGDISISTSLIETLNLSQSASKQFIELEITDTGIGIKKENLPKIFEPNYTTKITGTGFGLAIIKFIIDQIDGKISIKSKPDLGTTITLKIPVT